MKSILYIGIIAMTGASIYGFVDYKKTVRSKEFRTMYVEPVTEEPAITDVKEPATKTISTPAEIKKDVVVNTVKEKSGVKRKKDLFSKKRKNEKKINYSLFSRAPLRELEETVPVKAEKDSHQ